MLRAFQNTRALGQPRPFAFTGVRSISFQAFGSEPITGGEGVSIKPEDQTTLLPQTAFPASSTLCIFKTLVSSRGAGAGLGRPKTQWARQGQGSVGSPCGRGLVVEEEGADADSWERLLDPQPRSQG